MASRFRLNGFLHFLLTGEPFSPEEIVAVRKEISFTDAIDAHIAWKNQLEHALRQPPVAVRITRDVNDPEHCLLGKWITGPGYRRYGNLSSFDEIRVQHDRFHRLAGEIAELHSSRQFALAETLMNGGFQDASHQIVKELRRFSELFGS
jgi:hypothetical protein